MMPDLSPIWLTLKLASVTTVILLILGLPLAYWLAFGKARWKVFIEPLVSMPLVLPPTVLGFYILLIFNPNAGFGGWLEEIFHTRFVFSFAGLVIGSVIFSLPFMVNPIKSHFQSFPRNWLEASWTLGRSSLSTFVHVILPNSFTAIGTGLVMTFAHTIGEFGVVLMIGGNIPNQTRVASIAVYSEVEALNYGAAHMYSIILFVMCFVILFVFQILNRRMAKVVA